jgi:hypothetical protein
MNLQKFVEINLDDNKQSIRDFRSKQIDYYLFKKMGLSKLSEQLNLSSITNEIGETEKNNIVKYFLDFKNPKKSNDIGVDVQKVKLETETCFVKLIYSLVNYHKKGQGYVFASNLEEYKKHLEDALKEDKENRTTVYTTNWSILIQLAMTKNHPNAILEMLKTDSIDINEIYLRKQNKKFVFFVAEKGKHVLLEACLNRTEIKMMMEIESKENVSKVDEKTKKDTVNRGGFAQGGVKLHRA